MQCREDPLGGGEGGGKDPLGGRGGCGEAGADPISTPPLPDRLLSHISLQAALVSKRLPFPSQPPNMKSLQTFSFASKYQRETAAWHGPTWKGSRQSSVWGQRDTDT